MPLPQVTTKTPTTIGRIRISLSDNPSGRGDPFPQPGKAIRYNILVYDQNGEELRQLSGDLRPFLTANQITQLEAFMDTLRAKAVSEVLG